MLCSVQSEGLTHLWSDPSLSISSILCYCKLFFILISDYVLVVYRNTIDSWLLILYQTLIHLLVPGALAPIQCGIKGLGASWL